MAVSSRIRGYARSALDPIVAAGLTIPALITRRVRETGLEHWPVTQRMLLGLGVYPLRDHYYDPQIRPNGMTAEDLLADRFLPGIDLREDAQRNLLATFRFQDELAGLPRGKPEGGQGVYWFDNEFFERIDGSILYSMLRTLKPRRIVEVGSGFSTLIAQRALERNAAEGAPQASHVCIEPYEHAWLDQCGAQVVRERVERVDPALITSLRANDVLFIDSSHVLRPGGDVVVEILQFLPSLAPGVVVHIHDIFTPKDYPFDWLFEKHRLWTEQYMLEAFLSMNDRFEIMLGVQHMWHDARGDLEAACVPLDGQGPGTSFYIRRK